MKSRVTSVENEPERTMRLQMMIGGNAPLALHDVTQPLRGDARPQDDPIVQRVAAGHAVQERRTGAFSGQLTVATDGKGARGDTHGGQSCKKFAAAERAHCSGSWGWDPYHSTLCVAG